MFKQAVIAALALALTAYALEDGDFGPRARRSASVSGISPPDKCDERTWPDIRERGFGPSSVQRARSARFKDSKGA